MKLFEVPVKQKEKPINTCRKCKFRYKHEYGKMFYCSKQKQKGTSYGDKKIKAGDSACNLFKLNT
jgi:hypothetical protein